MNNLLIQKQNKNENEGLDLLCQRCGHDWKYRGKNPYVTCCPFCHTSVRVRKTQQAEAKV